MAGRMMGVTQGPFDAWLNVRSLKTLPLRMAAHSRNAQIVAEWLEKHPAVGQVMYPGLPSHPQHELAKKLMPDGLYGGMLGFELAAGPQALSPFVKALKEIQLVPSLADVITTLSHPAITSHRSLTPEQRAGIGVRDELLRLSVGIEDPADILEDLEQAFRQL
jgi:cystathionine beta-lyase/cystathionine gamma-synthase